MLTKPEPMLWLDANRGVYIPRDFARSFANRDKDVDGVAQEDWLILEDGPEHELYWETWSDVEQNCSVTDEHGNVFRVYLDGDCWLIPANMEWSEELDWFTWPETEDQSS